MNNIEIAPGKRARTAYSFDDIAIVPSRRTRDPENVSTTWQIDAYKFDLPMLAAPMDSVVSPETAIAIGKLGGLGVLNLEGLWTRYEDPRIPLGESLSPARTAEFHKSVIAAGVDIFVIRGTTASAEHVAAEEEALNLKKFIYELDVPVIVGGVATSNAALHLMRAGAAGVLVGFGGGAAHTTRKVLGVEVPMASAVAEVAAARREYLDESGGRYVHVIADGSVGHSRNIAKAIACGADAVMMGSPLAKAVESPGLGWHWGSEAHHSVLPRGERVNVGTVGTLEEILLGPSHTSDGSMNLFGALRRAMATCGYSDVKEFQRVEVLIHRG